MPTPTFSPISPLHTIITRPVRRPPAAVQDSKSPRRPLNQRTMIPIHIQYRPQQLDPAANVLHCRPVRQLRPTRKKDLQGRGRRLLPEEQAPLRRSNLSASIAKRPLGERATLPGIRVFILEIAPLYVSMRVAGRHLYKWALFCLTIHYGLPYYFVALRPSRTLTSPLGRKAA